MENGSYSKSLSESSLIRKKILVGVLIAATIILTGLVVGGWVVLQSQADHVDILMDRVKHHEERLEKMAAMVERRISEADKDDGNEMPPSTLLREKRGSGNAILMETRTMVTTKQAASEVNTLNSGVVYIRWGRTSCPSFSTLLYKGEAAGSWYAHTGGGSNYQCLPDNPQYLNYSDSVDAGAWIYGAEYQTPSFSPFRTGSHHDQNVPCAACQAKGRYSKLMIPGRITCPDNRWTVEYVGYLMTAHYLHSRTTYECVDQDAAGMTGGDGNQDGALFYPVQSSCVAGRLVQCPPYVQGREVACVVCSR